MLKLGVTCFWVTSMSIPPKSPYNKPVLTIETMVEKLIDRGLVVSDVDRVKRYLININYYRLSAYFIPFEKPTSVGLRRNHDFIEGTTFDDILSLYIFDRKLRLLVTDAIERIEIAVRGHWAYEMAQIHGAHAYLDELNFTDFKFYKDALRKVKKDTQDSSETFVLHYMATYDPPSLPPIWAIVETLTIGALSKWYDNTRNSQIKRRVAKSMGFKNEDGLSNMLQVLTLVRNICAHHARLWNRKLVKRLIPFQRYDGHSIQGELELETTTDVNGDTQTQSNNLIFNSLVMLIHIMRKINPSSSWPQRLKAHVMTLPEKHWTAMGLPNDWQQRAPWHVTIAGDDA